MDTAKYSYYIRTAGVPAAALPNVPVPASWCLTMAILPRT